MSADVAQTFSVDARTNIIAWLEGEYDVNTKTAIQQMISTNPDEVENAFYTHLSFGTGGMRGLMGVGPNRMNIYTVRQTTKGLANYLKKMFPLGPLRVVIGFDSRNNSKLFAMEAARVLASSSIEVYLFKELRPTPLVSFACRLLQANSAIMITASHNPPEYNGYKVYWSDGGQVLPPHDKGIMAEVDVVRVSGVTVRVSEESDPYIHILEKDIDEAYLRSIKQLELWPGENKESLSVLYSSLHGTGGTLVPQALHQIGVANVSFVKEQMIPDGSFPTTRFPNPEEKTALSLGIDALIANQRDLFLATDPDADRLGAVINHKGEPQILTGNHIASIMAEYILSQLSIAGKLPQRAVIVKSFVTNPLINKIAAHWGASCVDVLPGFKYIAQKIQHYEQMKDGPQFVFGCEESYGYLYGTHARDKDAVVCSCVLAEIAWYLKKQGKTLVDALHTLWETYGYFEESLITYSYGETKAGRDHMRETMKTLRETPPTSIAEYPCLAIEDLLLKEFSGDYALQIGKNFPKSDALLFTLKDLTRIIIRPSGTEPKIKIYFQVTPSEGASLTESIRLTKLKTEEVTSFTSKLLQ